MKIRSLILGSVAAAGLSTGAMAADLGVLASLDVCDALGLSGLTISSDTNCLQISGFVSYELRWGDYQGNNTQGGAGLLSRSSDRSRRPGRFGGNTGIDGPLPGNWNGIATQNNDWRSTVEAWVKLVGSARPTSVSLRRSSLCVRSSVSTPPTSVRASSAPTTCGAIWPAPTTPTSTATPRPASFWTRPMSRSATRPS